jgi:hypothetical protein
MEDQHSEQSNRLNERKVVTKRRYTESHPAKTVGMTAKIRNKMLEAIADGSISQQDFDSLLSELSSDSKRWMNRNGQLFNVSEDGISLSSFGKRILKGITVNEATEENPEVWVPGGFDKALSKMANNDITYDVVKKLAKKHKVFLDDAISYVEYGWSLDLKENKTMENNRIVFESFQDFINSDELLSEATVTMDAMDPTNKDFLKFLKKNKVEIIETTEDGPAGFPEITMQGKKKDLENVLADGELGWDDAGLADYIEEGIITEAFKSSKLRNLLTMSDSMGWGKRSSSLPKAFYQLTKMKLDQIGDEDLMDMTPKEAYKAFANNRDMVVFYVVDNDKENPFGHGTVKPGLLALTRGKDFLGVQYERNGRRDRSVQTLKGGDDRMTVGGNKVYKGYDATGVSSIKRAADLADRAIAFSLTNPMKSSREDIATRVDQKSGATAFKSDVDFKRANKARYQEILAAKASKLPLDKMVNDAIDQLANQIKDGLAKNEKGRYGDIIIGKNSKGREAKMRDASNHMSNILDDYSRYVDYIKQAEDEKQNGYSSNYYEKESKNYAKEIKDKVSKIKKFDYAW